MRLLRRLTERGLIDGAVAVEPLATADAAEIARLQPLTGAPAARSATAPASRSPAVSRCRR